MRVYFNEIDERDCVHHHKRIFRGGRRTDVFEGGELFMRGTSCVCAGNYERYKKMKDKFVLPITRF